MNTDHLPDYDIPWKPIGREPASEPRSFAFNDSSLCANSSVLNRIGTVILSNGERWSRVTQVTLAVLSVLLLLGACSSPTDPSPYIVVVAGGLTTPSAPQQSDYAMGAN